MDDPFCVNLIPLKGQRLAVHFKLTDEGEIEFQAMSDMLAARLTKAFPRVEAERSRLYEGNIPEGRDTWKERMRQAVSLERQREFGCNADMPLGAHLAIRLMTGNN